LCELPGPVLGGSWNREGSIIFGYNTGGLYRVSQAGGVAAKLTAIDEAHGEIAHIRPWFLPDGRHFVYVTRTRNLDDSAIYVATLDSTERKRVVSAKQAGAYAPPASGSENGHLLFLRETTLMAQPMHPRTYDPRGEPFPVAEQVGSVLAMGYFSVSGNGLLAFRLGGAAGFGFARLALFSR